MGQAASLSECEERASEAISGVKSAVLLLKVPEDTWISDIDGFAASLSERAENADVFLAAQRHTGAIYASAFIK